MNTTTTTRREATHARPTVRARWADARAARASRRVLERELASYRTSAEVYELLAHVDSTDGDDREAIASILVGRLQADERSTRLAS